MSLLGLDVGTTGCKAMVFDLEGTILSSAYREYPLLHPRSGQKENAKIYEEKFAVYKDIYPTLRELNHQIRDLSAHRVS